MLVLHYIGCLIVHLSNKAKRNPSFSRIKFKRQLQTNVLFLYKIFTASVFCVIHDRLQNYWFNCCISATFLESRKLLVAGFMSCTSVVEQHFLWLFCSVYFAILTNKCCLYCVSNVISRSFVLLVIYVI